jgi:cytochrome c oxidase assembly factor CtaG
MGLVGNAAGESGDLWRAWSPDILVLAASALALTFFVLGWWRLRRRRKELAPWSRLALFAAGVGAILVGIVSPLDAIAEEYLQSAHMLQHVLIADVGVALIVVALRGPLSVFFLPPRLLAPLARRGSLRALLAFLLRPVVAIPLWLVVLVAWHLPPLYEAALRHPLPHRVQHLSFVVVGLLVWTLIIDPTRHGRLTIGERAGLVALLFWIGQLMSYVMVFSTAPFYDIYADAPRRLLGLSPLTDQKLAGVVMMIEQLVVFGLAFALLLRQARRTEEPIGATPGLGRPS